MKETINLKSIIVGCITLLMGIGGIILDLLVLFYCRFSVILA